MIYVTCSKCGTKFPLLSVNLGCRRRCPVCKHYFGVREEDPLE